MELKQSDLSQFIGTVNYYQHWLGLRYTDGVKYVAEHGKAHWLIDAIASWQLSPEIKNDPMLQKIQFWRLRVNNDYSAVLTCERDSGNIAITQSIELLTSRYQKSFSISSRGCSTCPKNTKRISSSS